MKLSQEQLYNRCSFEEILKDLLQEEAKSQKEGGENEEKGCEKNEEKCGGWFKISIVHRFCFLKYNSIVPTIYF